MRKILREPLLHFLIIGAGIFFVSWLMNGPAEPQSGRIVVTPGQIERLTATFKKTWQRPPTRPELDGLIEDYVRDEIFYREALAVGLDKDDTVIRRRLRQKMEFITEDLAAQAEPGDDELRAYLKKHAQDFFIEPQTSFQHIYLSPDKRTDAGGDARQLLDILVRTEPAMDTAELGDPFLLPREFGHSSGTEIARLLGKAFATDLERIEPLRWSGPIPSSYGIHLVFVRNRIPGRTPALDEVRDAVKREWLAARRKQIKDDIYRDLRKRYTVVIELPATTDGEATQAAELK